jgi:hypothetical protein
MFCERIKVKRIAAWRETGDNIEDVETSRIYAANRVVLRTDTALYVTVKTIANFDAAAFVREALDKYTYVTNFVANAVTSKAPGADTHALAVTPYMSDAFDKVLNVMQAMGQWAWAYCAVLDLLGATGLNARNITWDGVPHMSRIGVHYSGRQIWFGGAIKQVLEYWFIAHGGYHSRHDQYVSDRAEYERACLTVANPWALANQTRTTQPLSAEWLPAATAPVFAPEPGDQVSADLVLYRAGPDGRILPRGYATTDNGERPVRLSWPLAERAELLGRLGVPFQLREGILSGN